MISDIKLIMYYVTVTVSTVVCVWLITALAINIKDIEYKGISLIDFSTPDP